MFKKLATVTAKVKATMRKIRTLFDMADAFVFGGLGCVGYGIAQVYAPLAWIVVGAALFWLGVRK